MTSHDIVDLLRDFQLSHSFRTLSYALEHGFVQVSPDASDLDVLNALPKTGPLWEEKAISSGYKLLTLLLGREPSDVELQRVNASEMQH
jgi:hypothetical protein